MAKKLIPDKIGLLFQMCWAIWKTRNDCIFNSNSPRPEKTIGLAFTANSDYLQAVFKGSSEGRRHKSVVRIGKWTPPPPGVTKFNCDGAYSSSRNKAAFGFLARDSGGSALVWRAGQVVALSASFVEAWALRIACGMAVDMGITEALFESDCKVLIDCINSDNAQGP
ncbi:hypothetical protein RHMOL_Rhmol11G0062100 [Rhododendron molle]|uniref:Uncharacterized protein n=1 Tax=Rhododendron molle TaxID=49168 RepID=A0ACC0LQ61_RHOML|nr:hypothetical protein RHMOL_Rhmol11G0062100 [Rhododendron molle]